MLSPPRPDRLSHPSRRRVLRAGLGLFVCVAGCSEAVPAPRVIKWGRDTCDYCHMVFADRRFAAEIWDPETHRSRIYDDFGCAVLAAGELGVLDRNDVPFWVTDDAAPDHWLDARAARYRDGTVTPMGYGYSAGPPPTHPLDFRTAAAAIREKADCAHKS